MPATSVNRLLEFINNVLLEATHMGFRENNPVTMTVYGSTVQGDLKAPCRRIVVSSTPPVIDSREIKGWIKPETRQLYVCSPDSNKWVHISEMLDLWVNTDSVQGVNAGVTNVIPGG